MMVAEVQAVTIAHGALSPQYPLVRTLAAELSPHGKPLASSPSTRSSSTGSRRKQPSALKRLRRAAIGASSSARALRKMPQLSQTSSPLSKGASTRPRSLTEDLSASAEAPGLEFAQPVPTPEGHDRSFLISDVAAEMRDEWNTHALFETGLQYAAGVLYHQDHSVS